MDYKDYQQARNMSWEILIQENIRELPINIVELCHSLGIEMKYDNELVEDGHCTIHNGVPYIVINPDSTRQRKRFTIAHELGHLLLGHVGKYELVNRDPSPNDNPIERAANVFAGRLLAPACVLWGCNARTAEDIMELCDISAAAADIRAQRLAVLYERGKFLTSPLERQVYEQFRVFITNHQHQASY